MYRSQFWIFGIFRLGLCRRSERTLSDVIDRARRVSPSPDLPTQCGYDADHPLAAGEVGVTGVPSIACGHGTIVPGHSPRKFARSERRQRDRADYRGGISQRSKIGVNIRNTRMFLQNDFKEYFARGTYLSAQAALKFSSELSIAAEPAGLDAPCYERLSHSRQGQHGGPGIYLADVLRMSMKSAAAARTLINLPDKSGRFWPASMFLKR
jgi:hypothetical protein